MNKRSKMLHEILVAYEYYIILCNRTGAFIITFRRILIAVADAVTADCPFAIQHFIGCSAKSGRLAALSRVSSLRNVPNNKLQPMRYDKVFVSDVSDQQPLKGCSLYVIVEIVCLLDVCPSHDSKHTIPSSCAIHFCTWHHHGSRFG